MTIKQPKESTVRRTLAFVREAMRDNNEDFTRGPVRRALGLLAIPMMLEMAMESIFAVADIAFVSRLGTNAVAAVGITEALLAVLYGIAIGLGMGVTAMIARRTGSGDMNGAAAAAGQSIWIGLVLSIGIGIAGSLFARDLLVLMGASEGVIAEGAGYTTIILGGSFSIIFLFLLTAAFRGAGDASVALRSLWLANGINIVLDPCLIFGLGPFPELGVTGAAIATTIGRGAGVAYLLWYLFSGAGRLAFLSSHLRFEWRLTLRILRISIGGVSQFLISTASWIAVMRIVAIYGSSAVAAFTIALRILEFIFLPAWGLGNAAATLVGQNMGAGKIRRAEHSAWQAAKYNTIFMTASGIVLLIFAGTITGWFTNDAEVLAIGTSCMRILAVSIPLYAIGMIIVQALNGAGDTISPSIVNFVCFWIVQIPLAYWLATTLGYGPNGAFFALMIAESLVTILAVLVFRRGAWKQQKV